MSLYEDELGRGPDEVLALRTGSRVPFTMVGDWVLMSTLTVQAKLLYALLQAHVNVQDGTRKVWPSRETLANWMGFNRPQSVDKYIDELAAFGAITVERAQRGMRTRHTYIVNGEAPDGLTTPVRFADFYRARNEERDKVRGTAGEDAAGRAVMRSSAQQGADKVVSAGDSVVRPSAQRCAPQQPDDVRSSAPELDQVLQQDQEGGSREADIAQSCVGTSDRNGPPPREFDLADKATWLCKEHLPLLLDPGADRPPCAKCRRTREWAEAKLAERELQRRHEMADEAERARLCTWHDDAGWVVDPETGDPLRPAVKCDHRRPPAAVKASAPRPDPGYFAPDEVREQAIRLFAELKAKRKVPCSSAAEQVSDTDAAAATPGRSVSDTPDRAEHSSLRSPRHIAATPLDHAEISILDERAS